MILPGSAYRLVDREAISHYGDIVGQVSLTVPAGSVIMGHYGVWHKAGPKLNNRKRGMIKFSYFRTVPPQRDWITEVEQTPEYRDQQRLPYITEVEAYRDRIRCRRTWEWMCGDESHRDHTEWGTDGVIASGAKPISKITL